MFFVVRYHPKFKDLGKLIENSQILLQSDSEVRRVFSPAPIVSYRSARKIKDCVVGSNLYPTERKVESSKCCNPRCPACTSIQVTDTSSSLSLNLHTKSIIILAIIANVSSTFQVAKHVVNNTVVKQLRNLGADGILKKPMLEKQLVVT